MVMGIQWCQVCVYHYMVIIVLTITGGKKKHSFGH